MFEKTKQIQSWLFVERCFNQHLLKIIFIFSPYPYLHSTSSAMRQFKKSPRIPLLLDKTGIKLESRMPAASVKRRCNQSFILRHQQPQYFNFQSSLFFPTQYSHIQSPLYESITVSKSNGNAFNHLPLIAGERPW